MRAGHARFLSKQETLVAAAGVRLRHVGEAHAGVIVENDGCPK